MTEAPEQPQLADDIDPPVIDDRDDDSGDDDGDRGKWVTAATFWTPAEAQLARLKLESEDIDCVLFDENVVATDWLMASAVGGIKLKVREGDLEAAHQSLQRESDTPESEPNDTDTSASIDPEVDCPNCGSGFIARPWVSRRVLWAFIVALLLSGVVFFLIPITLGLFVYYLIAMRPLKCKACGYEWHSKSTPPHGFPVVPAPSSSAREQQQS